MTVKELIVVLQKMRNQDMEVFIADEKDNRNISEIASFKRAKLFLLEAVYKKTTDIENEYDELDDILTIQIVEKKNIF